MKPEFITPFGPTIMCVDIPMEYVDKLNEYMDNVVNDEQLSIEREYRPNLVGHIELEKGVDVSHAPEIWQEMGLHDWMFKQCETYVYHKTKSRGEIHPSLFKIPGAWINDMVEGEWNPTHEHAPSTLSVVGYLKVPESFVEDKIDGLLTWYDGRQALWTKSGYAVLPIVGKFYFFPGWLLHAVMPFYGEGLRRSMSVNFDFTYRDYGPQQF